jgi:hypothetical protein
MPVQEVSLILMCSVTVVFAVRAWKRMNTSKTLRLPINCLSLPCIKKKADLLTDNCLVDKQCPLT